MLTMRNANASPSELATCSVPPSTPPTGRLNGGLASSASLARPDKYRSGLSQRDRWGGTELVAVLPATSSSTMLGSVTGSTVWDAFWAFHASKIPVVLQEGDGSWRCGLCNVRFEASLQICLSCLGPRLWPSSPTCRSPLPAAGDQHTRTTPCPASTLPDPSAPPGQRGGFATN